MKTLKEILKRKTELRSMLEKGEYTDLKEIETEINQLDKEQDEIERRSLIIANLSTGVKIIEKPEQEIAETQTENVIDTVEYRTAYLKNLQGKMLNDIEERALTTATSSAGYAVPTQTLNQITEKLKQEAIVLPLVTVLNVPSNVSMPIEGTINDAVIKAEGASSSDAADTIGNLSLTAYKMIKTISITAEVSAMTIDAFETFIVAQLVKKIKSLVDYLIVNGTGTNQATGILKALDGDGNSITTTATTGFTYSDLMDLLGTLKSGYAKNAVLMAKRSFIYGTIANIQDNNKRPIFKIETDGRFEGKLLGYPIVANDDIPDNTIIFGDFSYYFWNFVQNPSVEVDKSVGFRSGDTCYRVMALGDGNVGLKEAFVIMTKKAA